MKERVEILVAGFGGQGVVRLGQILGETAMRQGFRVTMLKSHGTEQRGGYVRSQIVISNTEIDSPQVEEPDFFLALSPAAYNAYHAMLRDGIILFDPAYVKADESLSVRQIPVPAKELAVERLGNELFSNSIMLGALTKLAQFLSRDNMLDSLLNIVPRYKQQNKQAFAIGLSSLQNASDGGEKDGIS